MANPIPGQDAIDVGGGIAATRYDDGSVVFWNITTGQGVAQTPPGGADAADLGNGNAATVGPNGAIQVWNIASGGAVVAPPGQSSASAAGAVSAAGAGASAAPAAAAGTGFQALPGYAQFAMKQPGYIPGNTDYNQWRLDRPGLFDAQGNNLQFGSGSIGDPTNGTQPQNAASWRDGGQLFVGDGTNLEGEYSVLGNTLARVDAGTNGGQGSGASSVAFPDWAKPTLLKAIAEGRLTPTARGQQYMAEVLGIAPTQYGNKVAQPTQGAGAAGAGASGNVFNFEAQKAEDAHAQAAADTAYRRWLISSGDEKLAFDKATEAYAESVTAAGLTGQFQGQQTQAAQQQQFAQGITAAGVTGMYNGEQTLAARQADAAQANQFLQTAASLRGPENYAQYLRTFNSAPQGLLDVVNSVAGRYGLAGSAGSTGGQQAASLSGLINGLQPQNIQQQTAEAATAFAGLPSPNQINLKNWSALNPSQQALTLGGYEAAGFNPNDVTDAIKKAAPKYGLTGQAAYTF